MRYLILGILPLAALSALAQTTTPPPATPAAPAKLTTTMPAPPTEHPYVAPPPHVDQPAPRNHVGRIPSAPNAAAAQGIPDTKGCADEVDPAIGLTECQALKLQYYRDQVGILQPQIESANAQQMRARQQYTGFVKALEASTGRQWQEPTPDFPNGRLIVPPPPAPAATSAPAPTPPPTTKK